MQAKLYFIQGKLTSKFPKYSEALWVSQEMLPQTNEKDLNYAKLTCTEPLQEFVMFVKLETLNGEYNQNNCYINPEILPKKHVVEDLPVSIELLAGKAQTLAKSITISVPSEKVVHWSADDIRFTANFFKTQHRIVYTGQTVLLKADMVKIVPAKIQSIYPKENEQLPFLVDKDTSIVFEGFPKNQQKAIDFSKIGGLDRIISALRNIIQIPLAYPDLLTSFDITPPKGMLLHGPPGNGKTLLAKAIAESMGASFVAIEGPELHSKYVGEGERRLRDKFEEAAKHKLCVLFIDEIDAIASNRNKEQAPEHQISTVATLLNLMDGMQSSQGVFVIGATNRLNALDSALRRPGRFELEFEVPLPDRKARFEILSKTFNPEENRHLSQSITERFLQQVSERTHGFSGADLVSLYRQSVMQAISKQLTFNEKTAKFDLNSETQILLEASDVWDTLKRIVPTHSRGIEGSNPLAWDQLIMVASEQKIAEQVHQKINAIQEKPMTQRAHFLNISVIGKTGSGRRTTWCSFAKRYNYEWHYLDASDHHYNVAQFLTIWKENIEKAKLIAPSIVYIDNYASLSELKKVSEHLKNELSKLPPSYPIICIVAVPNEKELEESNLLGYRGFNMTITFSNAYSERDVEILSEKYGRDNSYVRRIIEEKKTVGETLEAIEKDVYQLCI